MQQMLNQDITATIAIILIATYSGSNAPTVMTVIAVSTGTTRENQPRKSYALIKKD